MRIGIIALGLIGGSLLKNLSDKGIEVVAVTQNPETITAAKRYCMRCTSDIREVKNCNVVFVCTPISKTCETLDELEGIVSKDCIVTDVASVKRLMMRKKYSYKFIGGHPMAGLETSGFKNSVAFLFEGARWVLTPSENATDEDVQTLKKIIKFTGAKTIITSAEEHDYAVALISHLPMLVAQGLMKNAEDDKLAMQLAASGFRDSTRLAMTDKQLAEDMLIYNRDNIEDVLAKFMKQTNALFGDENYAKLAVAIALKRYQLYSIDGKNIYNAKLN